MSEPNWFVLTGGPSTGKTSLLRELQNNGLLIVPEAARTVIDEAALVGVSVQQLRADEKDFQEQVARAKEKIERNTPKDKIVFFDRGMHDTLAYLEFYDFPVEAWVQKLTQSSDYKRVYVLEPLDVYEQDYARTENKEFSDKIEQLLIKSYESYGIKVVRVPNMTLEMRTQFILEDITREQ